VRFRIIGLVLILIVPHTASPAGPAQSEEEYQKPSNAIVLNIISPLIYAFTREGASSIWLEYHRSITDRVGLIVDFEYISLREDLWVGQEERFWASGGGIKAGPRISLVGDKVEGLTTDGLTEGACMSRMLPAAS
jgi:hypothetical protein